MKNIIGWILLTHVGRCIGLDKPKKIGNQQPVRNKDVLQNRPDLKICQKLNIEKLFLRKSYVDHKMAQSIRQLKNDPLLSDKLKSHQLQVIDIFQREMNDSVISLHNSVGNLRSFLIGNYKSVSQLKEKSEKRLEQLKTSILKAEEEYNEIINTEKEEEQIMKDYKDSKEKNNKNLLKKFIDNLISDVSNAADELEGKLDTDEFEAKIHNKDNTKINIETVIKVGGEEKEQDENNEGVIMLVDSESNHFVLSKPQDSTITHVDHQFIKDLIAITCTAFVFLLFCHLLKLPSIFAYVMAGILLGPSGYNVLQSIVQIETIGEFGVFLVLFSLGIEFSPDKLRKVLRQSLSGILLTFSSFVFIGFFWGSVYGIKPQQSFFVSISLSLSSTPMVMKLLATQKHKRGLEHVSSDLTNVEDYSNLLISMLFLQDVTLGLFMAVLPILAGHSTEKSHSFAKVTHNTAIHSWFHGTFGGPFELMFFTLFELTLALIAIFFFAYVLSKYVAAKFFRGLNLFGSHESSVLGILSAVFIMLSITDMAGVSTELGCFICGGVLGTIGEQTSKQVVSVVEPLKDFFSTFFFASIGFHIFPSFVLSEILIFIPITLCIIATKFFVTSFVLHYILPKGSKSKWLVSAGLAQLSEFSFVLGSRARRYGLIGREIYLIILSVTTLSLLVAPFVWRSVHSTVMHGTGFNIKTMLKKIITRR